MYYSKPIAGRAFKPFSVEMVDVKLNDVSQWSFKKMVHWKRREYAIFTNDKGEEIMQSLKAIRFIRLRPGEDNFMAKLSNEQGIEVFNRANNGEPTKELASEFNISRAYVNDIKSMRSRIGVTLNYLRGHSAKPKLPVTVAKRDKGKKLSHSLAKFIRSDKVQMKLTVKQLAKKYVVSERTIQRILKGDMYPET